MEFLSNYIVPVIVAACLLIGFIIKKWVKDVDNKWIPTIVAIAGALLAILINWGNISTDTVLNIVVGGAISGLASTGLHQAFNQWIDGGGKE